MMKKIIVLTIVLLTLAGCKNNRKSEVKFCDIIGISIVNRAQQDGNPLMRLNVEKYPQLSEEAAKQLSFPAGMAVRFNTNSDFIEATWQVSGKELDVSVLPLAARGLDLYIKKDGKWLFAGVGIPNATGRKNFNTIVANMDTSMKECLLYLPIYEILESLKLGINPKSKLEFIKGGKRTPIVAIGSSYTHGAGASRPSMAWPAQLSRRLGVDIANLGTCGIQKMEPFFADILADTDADMFILDCFSNPTASLIRERLAPFIQIIRKKHPTTPLVFLQTLYREKNNFDLKSRKKDVEKMVAAEEELKKLIKSDKNIYFINPGLWTGDDHESNADNYHPSDMGYQRIVDHIEPHIRAIMIRYNVKPGVLAR